MTIFADRLRQFERSFRLRTVDLADALGLPPVTVKSWELGMTEPTLDQLRTLGAYSERSVDYFLGLDDRVMIDASRLSDESLKSLQDYVMFRTMCDLEKTTKEMKHARFIPILQEFQEE